MKRGPFFLAAALLEVLRFFVLMTFAAALGLLAQRSILPSFLRYLAVAQLIPAAGFFFLWYDLGRHAPYRPLLLTAKILSLLSYVPIGVSLLGVAAGDVALPGGRGALGGLALLPALDLFGVAVLVLHRRAPGADIPASRVAAQRGPEDIERVEPLS